MSRPFFIIDPSPLIVRPTQANLILLASAIAVDWKRSVVASPQSVLLKSLSNLPTSNQKCATLPVRLDACPLLPHQFTKAYFNFDHDRLNNVIHIRSNFRFLRLVECFSLCL